MSIWTRPRKIDLAGSETNFSVEISTISKPYNINDVSYTNLKLIAIKMGHTDSSNGEVVEQMNPVGYLYLEEETQKLYYSKTVYDRPEYLCDWVSQIADDDGCELWIPTITGDGDIIFLKRRERANPIIYPSGDYGNPFVIDVESESGIKPYGVITNRTIEHNFKDEYFCFGEYAGHSSDRNGESMNIWKVGKPYNSAQNWRVVLEDYFHQHYSQKGESDNPEYEIGHWHTCEYDPYNGDWVATSGDFDLHCRIIVSEDGGETWTEKASGHQKYRPLGIVFLKNGAWYGTDSSHHYLYFIPRSSSGSLKWDEITQVADLTFPGAQGSQRTYHTLYVREPEGLLFLDRAEGRADGKLDTPFYSFETGKIHNLGVFKALSEEHEIGVNSRYGWGNMVVTPYQSIYEDGVICGANSVKRRIKMDVLNNSTQNRLGVVKFKVVRK